MKKLLVIDLDGTLADTRADLAAAVNAMRASLALPPLPVDFVVRQVGDGISALIRRTLPAEADFAAGSAAMTDFYRQHLLDATKLYPQVKETLATLHSAGVVIALFSNKPQGACEKILTGLEIAPFFTEIIGGGGDFPLKPDPAALLYLREKFALPAKDCYMFGDHQTDIAAARRAGFRSIFASFGFGRLGEDAPDSAVNRFAEILPLLLGVDQ